MQESVKMQVTSDGKCVVPSQLCRRQEHLVREEGREGVREKKSTARWWHHTPLVLSLISEREASLRSIARSRPARATQ